jgi:hypothetical protein
VLDIRGWLVQVIMKCPGQAVSIAAAISTWLCVYCGTVNTTVGTAFHFTKAKVKIRNKCTEQQFSTPHSSAANVRTNNGKQAELVFQNTYAKIYNFLNPDSSSLMNILMALF